MPIKPVALTLSKWIIPLGLIGLLTGLFWDYTQDDVFITYVYSRNLIEGDGFTFNPGERVQGTTTPLYTLLMAGVHLLTDDLLHAGNLLSAGFLFLALAIAAHTSYPYLSRYARLGFGVLGASSGLVYVSFGMETLFYSTVLMLSFYCWLSQRRALAMLSAAALTWIRADGVVLGGVLGLLVLWEAFGRGKPTRRSIGEVIRLGVVYALGIMPWYGFAWLYFGSPLPNTFGAKQDSFGGLRFWSDGWNWFESFYGQNPLAYLGLGLALLGAIAVWRNTPLRPIVLWAIAYALGYTILNTTAFWYYTPWVLVLLLLVAFGAQALGRWAVTQGLPRRAVIVSGLVVILVAGGLAAGRAADFGDPPGRVRTYVLVGQWIEQQTPSEARLTIGDLGIMGYHARRYTLDSPGLIVPEMYYQTDVYAVAKYKTDLVVGTGYYTWVELTAQEWFKAYYRPLAQFSTAGDEFSPMTVYERRYPLATPATGLQGLTLALACQLDLPQNVALPEDGQVRLLQDDREVWSSSAPFFGGRYPARQILDPERIQEQHLALLPADLAPGVYQAEFPCGMETRQADLEILTWADQPDYQALNAVWPNGLRLQGGFFPSEARTWSGGALEVAWDWQATQALNDDWTLFLHLSDAEGRVWAQADGIPRPVDGPWSAWELDQTMMEQRQLSLPPDLPAGRYQLLVGVYNWRTGERLALANGDESFLLPLVVNNQWPGGTGLP